MTVYSSAFVIFSSFLYLETNAFALYQSKYIFRNLSFQSHFYKKNSILQLDFLKKASSITIPQESSKLLLFLAKKQENEDDFDLGAFRDSYNIPEKASFGTDAIPEGQRPAQEYLDLIRSPLFDWAEKGNQGLFLRLVSVYSVVFVLVSYPIAGATFTEDGYLIQKIAAANLGSISIIFALIVRLYSGWGYVGSRLQTTVVEYEESGWYDGAFQKKTDVERKRDLFMYQNNVKPIIERVKLFSLATGALWLASCVALKLATTANPLFNPYNPDMLMKLQSNEELANVSAERSNAVPTYCNNRYYRAVAGGGQGCKN